MNNTPRSNRIHIALFGKRNAGKSSLINALTQQDIALVSDVLGTTTDPVFKSMEILPLGPVVLIDTAGLDDTGELGELRIKKSLRVLNKTDIAIIVVDAREGISHFDEEIIKKVKEKNIPAVIAVNKMDLVDSAEVTSNDFDVLYISSKTKEGVKELRIKLGQLTSTEEDKFRIVGDLVNPGDFVVLVTPIDKAAPKGRLILPQQQVIRDLLESDCIAIVTKEYELRETLENLGKKPSLVITDSQAFLKVSADTPHDIPLTSFSILFARFKGDLMELVKGAKAVNALKNGDKVLIAEGCTHHRQSDDIGTVKIPRWLRQYTGKQLEFDHFAGHGYPEDLEKYDLVIHCGACMLNEKEVVHRIHTARDTGTPIVNYGVLIAYLHGIFDRALELFPEVLHEWQS